MRNEFQDAELPKLIAIALEVRDRGPAREQTGQKRGLVGSADGRGGSCRPIGAPILQLYDALRAGGKQHQTMRLSLFAAMGELGLAQRDEFAKRVGAVFRQSDQSRLNAYTGDFSNLLFLQTNGSESVYARAVRNYAMVLESKEIVAALIHIGAVQEDLARDQWTIRIEHKMQDFDAQTLMSIHERIEPAFIGNRKYLRDQLEDFAKSKR